MARKPGIHGHKQLLPHKSWYNYPNHLSIKLTQNKEDLSNDNTRTIGEIHHKRKHKKTKSRHIYGNRFSDISLHPMDQYKWEI